MLFYVRAISYKLYLSIGRRNHIIQSNRKLSKLLRTSAFTYKDTPSSNKSKGNEIIKPHSSINITQEINLKNLDLQYCSTVAKLAEKANPITESERLNQSVDNKSTDKNRLDGPTEEQLNTVYKTLEHDLPKFFVTTQNYSIYHPHLEFVNQFKGVVLQGLPAYIKHTIWIKIAGHVSFVYVKLDVLKITQHAEDNTVRVRWRIRGLSTWQALTNFYRLIRNLDREETWYDGFSTFYVGADGKVFKHVADKMMPDDNRVEEKKKPNIAAKLTT